MNNNILVHDPGFFITNTSEPAPQDSVDERITKLEKQVEQLFEDNEQMHREITKLVNLLNSARRGEQPKAGYWDEG